MTDDDTSEPNNYIDHTAGGDGYTEIKVHADSADIEGFAHGSATAYEFTTDNGEIVSVVVEGAGELDDDWLFDRGDEQTPRVWTTIATLGAWGVAVAAPHAMGFGFIATMLTGIVGVIAGIWIIEEVRRGYGCEEATA